MTVLDVTIVNVALVDIKSQLHTGVNALQWIIDGYALFFASFLLTAGAIGDKLGNKRIFILGLNLFTLASLFCGFSPSITFLEIGRVFQGLGAALLVPASLALVNHIYSDEKKKAQALGIYGSIGGFGAALGPILGGLLVSIFSWRSIFIVNIPIALLCAFLTFSFVAESPKDKKRSFDIPGQLLGIISLSALTFVFIESKTFGPFSLPIISSAFICIIATILFIYREKQTKSPMLPLQFFLNKTFSGATIISLLLFLNLYGELFVMSLFFQQIRHFSPALTGLALLPQGVALAIPTLFTGKLSAKIGVKTPIIIGTVCGILGYGGLALITTSTAYVVIAATIIGIGLTMAFAVPAITIVIVGSVDKQYSGIASSIYNVTRQVGSILGVAILGSLVNTSGAFLSGMRTAFILTTGACIMSLVITLIWIKQNK